MEQNLGTRRIAVIEKCTMTEVALRYILNRRGEKYSSQFFKDTWTLRRDFKVCDFSVVIFSLSGSRRSRLENLIFLHEVMHDYPEIRNIVLAHDEAEARLVTHLIPVHPQDILNKSVCRLHLQESLLQLLEQAPLDRKEIGPRSSVLSPTEHSILRYMICGYSIAEIAARLDRNIKTIRAHKFNVMSRLGVSSDIGLLGAADILLRLPVNADGGIRPV